MTTPPLDLPALKEIAKAATDGPWGVAHTPIDTPSGEGGDPYVESEGGPIAMEISHAFEQEDADAEHIAAFDPPTALALIARAEAAEEEANGFCADRNLWQDRASEAEKAVAAVREACHSLDANGNSRELGDPTGHTWHVAANIVRTALDGTP